MLTVVQPLKIFPAFYGTWGFIAVFTQAIHWSRNWSPYWATPVQPTQPHLISQRIISTTYPLIFPVVSFFQATGIPLQPHLCYMPCPFQPLWLDHSNTFEKQRKFRRSSCTINQPRNCLLSILLSTVFLNTLSLGSSHNVRDKRFTPIQNHKKNYSF
jgi:hypothetical protein